MLAIINGRLIDGTGGEPLERADLVVKDGLIESIGPAGRVGGPNQCPTIDATGKTILPGLIDVHVHLVGGASEKVVWSWGGLPPLIEHSLPQVGLRAYARALRTLEMGFTTLRDVGDIGFASVAVRDAVSQGLLTGPRLVCCGPYLNTSGGHGYALPPWLKRTDLDYSAADGVDGVIKAVRRCVKMNTDWVKFCATGGATTNTWDKQQFNEAEMKALIDEAHAKARPVSAHCVWAEGTLAAVRLGADSIEHGCDLTEEIVDLMAQKKVPLVPTLYAPLAIAEKGREFGFAEDKVESVKRVAEMHLRSLETARQAGVIIALGTDAGYGPPLHGANALEMELLTKNGFTNMEAIVSATGSAADLLGLGDELGRLKPGRRADLIVVDGDPLADIKLLQEKARIKLVMRDGRIVVDRMNASTKLG